MQRIQMRPGAASYGAVTPKGQIIFGLSGNPGGCIQWMASNRSTNIETI